MSDDTAHRLTRKPNSTTVEAGSPKLPTAALLALATAVLVTSLTETLPAGVLPEMSADLRVGQPAMRGRR